MGEGLVEGVDAFLGRCRGLRLWVVLLSKPQERARLRARHGRGRCRGHLFCALHLAPTKDRVDDAGRAGRPSYDSPHG